MMTVAVTGLDDCIVPKKPTPMPHHHHHRKIPPTPNRTWHGEDVTTDEMINNNVIIVTIIETKIQAPIRTTRILPSPPQPLLAVIV